MTIATATEVKNNFGFYLNSAIEGNDVVIMKNGKEEQNDNCTEF